jgi:hypothetical protein
VSLGGGDGIGAAPAGGADPESVTGSAGAEGPAYGATWNVARASIVCAPADSENTVAAVHTPLALQDPTGTVAFCGTAPSLPNLGLVEISTVVPLGTPEVWTFTGTSPGVGITTSMTP